MTVAPLPIGFRIEFDPSTRQIDESTWFGGSPARLLRLTRAGVESMPDLRDGVVRSRRAGAIARTLTDAGLAHPLPGSEPPLKCTVVIPVRDRPEELDRCLTAIGAGLEVIVVDDASTRLLEVAAVAARHGARLIVRSENGGPGAARNTGLAAVTTDLVAFVDSDTVPALGALDELRAYFADPLTGAVAPRIRPLPGRTVLSRYAEACSSLDLGSRSARVVPGGRVSYVPTAVLLARRSALESVVVNGAVFDPHLRYGEDVDLVWRLNDDGWRVRYVPSVIVSHDEPATLRDLLARRYRYGTSAGPLALRHGDALAPLVLHPLPGAVAASLVLRRPGFALVAALGTVWQTRRAFMEAGLSTSGSARHALASVWQTWLGTSRWATQLVGPVLLAAGVLDARGASRRTVRNAVIAGLLLTPALSASRERHPSLDPIRFMAVHLADDIAYGLGVWRGSIASRCLAALLPRVVRNPIRCRPRLARGGCLPKTRGSR